ncbi:MAG: serine/threonine-protein kinase, partial [Polyangiaceae bacterium]
MELAPGTPVTDSVRLVEPLGEGGMASVWIAEHTSLRTKVAVKFISKELLDEDSSMAERFAREASMSAQIKSPYVVQTFDHGVMPDGQPYIVMELLEGESLDHHLVRETILSLEMTNQVVSQTAKALSKAHKLGIVHRDIKPDNLFMTWEDEDLFVKVLDFGVAKRTNLPKADSVTGTGMMVGTPEFMSPEQVLSAKSVDLRADLWALAVVAYRCLTGRVPFQGETLGSLCVAIAGGQFTSPTELRPDLPSAVDRWFVRGLAVEADDRFGSARELAQSLSMALVGKVSGELSVSSLRGSPADWSGAHAPATTTGDVTVAPGQGSRTFAGTTMAPHQKNRRRTALLSLAAVALV